MLTPQPGIRGPLNKHTPLLVAGLRQLGCDVITEPWGKHTENESLFTKVLGRARDIRRIRQRLSGERFDAMVVKTSLGWMALLRDVPLMALTRRRDRLSVLQFHGSRSDALVERGHLIFKMLSRLLLRVSDGALVLSSVEQEEFQRFYPRGSFHVVSNPFLSSSGHAERRATESSVLLFVGRLIREKGIYDLLEAVALLRGRIACRLVVAGTGPMLEPAKERTMELGIEGDVLFAGYVDGDQLAAAYQSSDLFVLPTYWFEGFPTAITEAMDARLPIITTRTRGIGDHLDAGVNALFIPPRSPVELAEAIERLLRDSALRRRMGDANGQKVEKFSPDKVASQYLDALKRMMAAKENRTAL